MAFHFPLMPRMFMAIRREQSWPIVEIMDQTPPIPATCQWALFLRNHDELTLEMVTDEERDYMYSEYAKDPRMRLNLGIRRRLAPLMDNDRRQMELLHSLLFSLPGSPVLYYGDEIGMGDNIYLGDRNGVRTPMQWTGDRNAGFSRADPSRLYQPVILDPIYHYQAVNVEAQLRSPSSWWHWLKRLIRVRKETPGLRPGDVQDSCRARIAASWPTCASTRSKRCWSSTIFRRSRNPRASTFTIMSARSRSKFLATTRSPRSARNRIRCRLVLMRSSGFASKAQP